jgi:MoaA/NifB/PqqE/SkfB family radical SAM enzyme
MSAVDEQNRRQMDALEARDRRPTGVMIQVSAKCNLGCVMCGYVGRTPNVGFISQELFRHILDDCRSYGVSRIYMETAWGEPMLHPGIFELLDMARDFQIVLSTNLTPLNLRRIERLAELGLDTLQCSFCGYDRESYEATYVGANFDQVTRNLKDIQRIFASRSPATTLLVNGVSLSDNIDFVDRSVAYLKSLGFRNDQMEIKLPNNFGGLYKGSPAEGPTGIHTYKDLRDQAPDLCSVLTDNPGIYFDGRVTACGCLDNSSALIIGDIRTETLREMRYGSRYQELLDVFMGGDISRVPLCADCDVPYCSSRMIDYVSPVLAQAEEPNI